MGRVPKDADDTGGSQEEGHKKWIAESIKVGQQATNRLQEGC